LTIMEKPISRKQHGFADYTFIPFTAVAPEICGFEDEKTAASISRALSGMALLSALTTRAEWGLFKIVPFKAHLAVDLATGIFALSAPWLFGFSGNKKARNTFIGLGLVGITAGALSSHEEM